jgi:hypothetical protein
MKTFLSALVLAFALLLMGCEEEPTTGKCDNAVFATVRDLTGLDGCGFVFELADGTRLEPYISVAKEGLENPLYNFQFADGKTVWITYEEKTDVAGICMVGKIVTITCITEFPQIPACLKNKIEEIKAGPVRNPPASVWQYQYQVKTVYFIPQFCCDFPSVLYNSDCSVLCSPDGGLTGNGDGKCSDFFTERKNEVLIWRDSR